MFRMTILLVIISGAIAAHAGGQSLAPGDLAVAVRGGSAISRWGAILGIQPSGKVYTITPTLFRDPEAMVPAADNQGLWVATNGQTGPGPSILHVDAGGVITTMHSQFVRLLTMNVNSYGEIIASDGNRIYSISSAGITTLATGLPLISVRGTAFDPASGDLVLAVTGRIYRMSMRTPGKLTTLIDFGDPTAVTWGLDADPESGALFGSRQRLPSGPGNTIHEILRLDLGPTPSVTTIWGTTFIGHTARWDRSPINGRFYLPKWEIAPWTTTILEFDPRSSTVSSFATVGGLGGSSQDEGVAVAVAGSRYLTAAAPVHPGGTLDLLIQSPAEPGVPYVMALSFGFRPGIRMATGRKIHLNPDPLFFLSLTDTSLFSGFQGRLNTQGLAMGRVRVPAFQQLSGVRFFASAITLAANGVSTISEPLGVTIR